MAKIPFIQKLEAVTRAADWRLSFVPFIIGGVYLWLFWFQVDFGEKALLLVLFSLCTTFGFAGLGYFINEFFDQKSDRKAGKLNKLAPLGAGTKLALFGLFVAASLGPWYYLPFNSTTGYIIAAEIALFLLYSLPFPRLKSVPMLSGVIDASYAYMVPLLLSCHTYSLYVGKALPAPVWFFLGAVFCIGIRNIAIHHVNDIFNDLRSGNKTLPQVLGPRRTNRFLRVVLVLELGLFTGFFVWLSVERPWMWLWVVFFTAFVGLQVKQFWTQLQSPYLAIQPARHLPDRAYQFWFPLLMLGLLVSYAWQWVCIVPFHLILLVPRHVLLRFRQQGHFVWTRHIRPVLSVLVNYPIYYFFRLFGVDLRKENKSALDYFRRKPNKMEQSK